MAVSEDAVALLDPETLRTVRERGGTWAVYQNQAMDSALRGHIVCLRFGINCTLLEAPECMPDTPQYGAGWKYRRVATIDAAELRDAEEAAT